METSGECYCWRYFFVYKENNPEVFPCHSNKDEALTLIILRINSAKALKQAYSFKFIFLKKDAIYYCRSPKRIVY